MRAVVLGFFIFAAVAIPQFGNAQVYQFETPPPTVTAANAPWQLSGQPVFHAGRFYYPTGPTVFFDGRVMVRTDTYQGIPLYEDTTLEPGSIVYVPMGGAVMRPYERRREGALAGTEGSRTPSFPVEQPAPNADAVGTGGALVPEATDRQTSSGGTTPGAAPSADSQGRFVASGVLMIRPHEDAQPGSSGHGLSIEFDNARWYSAGPAVDYDPRRFEPAGEYHGYPVYRERGGPPDRIFVTTVADGPLAPFARR